MNRFYIFLVASRTFDIFIFIHEKRSYYHHFWRRSRKPSRNGTDWGLALKRFLDLKSQSRQVIFLEAWCVALNH
jgi:hypothetical protein